MTPTERSRMNSIIGVVLAGVVLLAGYYVWKAPDSDPIILPSSPQEVATTTTPVGSTEATTSGGVSTANFTISIGKSGNALGVSVRPISILEDSRCPTDVQCIQAGTVRLRARVGSNEDAESDMTLTLGTPVTLRGGTVELVSVTPGKTSGTAVKVGDYRFVFKVTRSLAEFEEKG